MTPKSFSLALFALALVGLSQPARADDDRAQAARDIRTTTRTHWDYQPGQGPRRPLREKNFFAPETPKEAFDPVKPPVAIEPGDYHNPPTAESKLPEQPLSNEPKIISKVEFGLQASNYHYHEADAPMKVQGPAGGILVSGTYGFGKGFFLRGDGRFVGGKPTYKGTGTSSDQPNYIGEIRATTGFELVRGHYGIAPYVGIGYRYLLSDLQKVVVGSARGYTRESQYIFAPIGVIPRMKLLNGAQLSLLAEYDPLIRGWQHSRLSDISAAWPDIDNKQKTGYGLRGEMAYETSRWSAGPFVNYWNINQSTTDCGTGTGAGALSVCAYEPHNHTVEYGVQFKYRLF